MAKNLERMGDHATNIAENIHFLVVGAPLRSERPKSDKSSFEMISPNENEANPSETPSN